MGCRPGTRSDIVDSSHLRIDRRSASDAPSPARTPVEIHAPHKPILTVAEALVHLSIVTAGILIALSLEGARQWYEHRSLVWETRENLHREIAANKAELAGYAENAAAMQKQL